MWWVDSLCAGFLDQIPQLRYGLFRAILAACFLLKFTVETRRGYYDYFSPDSFLRYLYETGGRLLPMSELGYRFLYLAKWPAAIALLLGVAIRPASLILVLAFGFELLFFFKFHANFFFLCSLVFVVFPPQALGLLDLVEAGGELERWWRGAESVRGSPVGPVLVVLTMSFMYVTTALRKCNRPFLSGLVVYQNLRGVLVEDRTNRLHFDGWYPERVRDFVRRTPAPKVMRAIAPFMWATVVIELCLPALLLHPTSFTYAALVGVAMHLGFTALFPATLLHFSIASIATYLLFAPLG